jgi:hypothetical protein
VQGKIVLFLLSLTVDVKELVLPWPLRLVGESIWFEFINPSILEPLIILDGDDRYFSMILMILWLSDWQCISG